MLDVAPSELLLVAFVALIVIGPKDLPKALRVVGYWVGKARGVARQFRQGFDGMVREAELEEMEKRWAAENERIMREHPAPVEPADAAADAPAAEPVAQEDEPAPVMVEQPRVVAAPADHAAPRVDGASS
jgi:sec-independent protein translocase protein TatB